VNFHAPVGLSTESEPSAGEVAALIRQMRDEGIRVLFVENVTDPRLVQQLAREADAVIGGTLYSDSLSGSNGPASTYLDMFRHNANEIVKAFTT
ncbi:MAG: zinc ABC transporter substrate-binding protein, partial [Gammaproteobacteria bacterium]|nr:zinc ABC transporter substrate-binding protein [Gammaproteobacteria bacterium]